MFQGAAPNTAVLQQINNLDKLGSLTVDSDFGSFSSNNLYYTGSITIPAKLTRFAWNGGGATSKNVITEINLTHTGSLYTAASPQINISYTNLETGSLVTVFNNLPTLVGKTINITGASGASTLTGGQRAIATGKGWTITG